MTRATVQDPLRWLRDRKCKVPPLAPPSRTPKLLPLTAAVVLSITTLASTASDKPAFCTDVLYLIEQSRSQFLAVRGNANSDKGDYDATFVLPEAQHCAIIEDAKKSTYTCTWKYPIGDKQARQTYHRFVEEMRDCIGHMAKESTDEAVNHPDYYASHYYEYPGGASNVSLKNKNNLMSTLIAVRIDGFRDAE